ncbi:transposase [Zooshikella ganghwensis]|uniref:Transposase n=1 Tax=Zooshikella ganghwensis TaxID=202772 RepID=A0A4P9VHX2_9GAMM|nr:transposase [Zooshikella ganghwensis]RDH41820.1 transposase [Zooshikella ganghwensis]
MDKQKRVAIKVNRDNQFDLFGGQPSVKPVNKKNSTTGRVFIDPAPHDIYLGVARLEDHLKQAGIKAPFVIRQLLQSQDWSTIEARYATSGRAPYAPICMVGLILYGILQGVSSLRGLEKFARVDLGCMWVTGGICPDPLYTTIYSIKNDRLGA